MSETKGNIYSLAKLAKERLKQNNYTKVKNSNINNMTILETYINNQKLKSKKNASSNFSSNNDDELYKKVCELIETQNVSNPVSTLIDRDFFAELDMEAKQFYIHTLTEKYKIMRNRYFREHPISLYM